MAAACARETRIAGPSGPGPCVCFDGWSDDRLAEFLRVPSVLCLDERCSSAPQPPPTLGLSLWISTRAAVRHDVAVDMADALVSRVPWAGRRRDDIETALQEALGNAVIHGNLGIASELRRSLEGLTEFSRAMDSRLADNERASRPLLIHAEWTDDAILVSVEDQGSGFDPLACPLPAPNAPCGRGLCTIRAVCNHMDFDRGGRRITMRFDR